MKNDREFVGTLVGFDEFVNLVLNDVTEYETGSDGIVRTSKVEAMLLNGSGIVGLVPGSSPEEAAAKYVGPRPM